MGGRDATLVDGCYLGEKPTAWLLYHLGVERVMAHDWEASPEPETLTLALALTLMAHDWEMADAFLVGVGAMMPPDIHISLPLAHLNLAKHNISEACHCFRDVLS